MLAQSIPTDFALVGHSATYLVRIWTLPPGPFSAWAVDDWEITEAASVVEVVAWGERRAGVSPFEVFARVPASDELVRLHGEQPNAEEEVEIALRRE